MLVHARLTITTNDRRTRHPIPVIIDFSKKPMVPATDDAVTEEPPPPPGTPPLVGSSQMHADMKGFNRFEAFIND